MSFSNAINVPFKIISLANIENVESLVGFESTYVGSKPGAIVQALIECK
jgi:ATP-dependent Lon protease